MDKRKKAGIILSVILGMGAAILLGAAVVLYVKFHDKF